MKEQEKSDQIMNDRVGSLIALMERHRVMRFSILSFCTLIAFTAVWLIATSAFERLARNNESELALAIATQQEPATPVNAPSVEVETSETSAPAITANDIRPVAPRIDMIGEPAVDVLVGESYTDDGARAFTVEGNELPLRVYVDGELTEMVMIDTSTPDIHEIEYRAVDETGMTTSITRTVTVH